MESATKRKHKAEAAQAITLASLRPAFFFFFAQTRYKDTSEVSKGKARKRAVGDIHAQFRRPFADQTRARMFTMYTKTGAMYARLHHRYTGTLTRQSPLSPFSLVYYGMQFRADVAHGTRRHNILRDRLPLCLRFPVLRNAIKISGSGAS